VVEQAGAPLDIYDRPLNTFVAGFIGSPAMNLFDASVVGESGARHIDLGGEIALPLPSNSTLAPGARVTCGVRPEHLVPVSNGIPARVVTIEPTGSETQMTLRIGEQTLVCLVRDRFAVSAGAWIMVEVRHLHLFDLATRCAVVT
jgi:multiple sugar transport system ATP-binding protein